MRLARSSPLTATVDRLFYPEVSKTIAYGYLIALGLSYIIVAVHTPIGVNPYAGHDDALYMRLGQSLSEGRWLGHYNQYTLMKGPGYPAFLAVANWLGISVSLAQALFHCAAVTFFVAVCHKFTRSPAISALLFALLLWHPISLAPDLLRIVREGIYSAQLLIILGSLSGALFYAFPKQRMLLAILWGAVLGWFWLTREEGLWIVPGLALLAGGAALHAFRERRVRELIATLAVATAVFAGTQFSFRSVNWAVYGGFVGVDVKEANFQRALRALNSVRSGGVRPFVAVTQATRERIYAVSPSFASLRQHLEGSREGWGLHSCNAAPITCGEVGAGWFLWALRDAAAAAGHYSAPANASAFFKQLADEIASACGRGGLECAPQLVGEMPPVNWGDVAQRLPGRYLDAFHLLLLLRPSVHLNASVGSPDDLSQSLRFLNYPLISALSGALDLTIYRLRGWYYRSGRAWLSARVTGADGSQADVQLQRLESPDIQASFKDPDASHQRFTIRTRCNDECVLRLETLPGEYVEKRLAEFRATAIGFALGGGHVHVDTADAQLNPLYARTRLEQVCARIRVAILTHYPLLFLPVLVLGALGFFAATFLYWKRIIWNTCYILALACWVLAFLRLSLLVLIDVTSFTALYALYLAPAYFLLVSAAVLSCAAWLQLFARVPPHGTRSADQASDARRQDMVGASAASHHLIRS